MALMHTDAFLVALVVVVFLLRYQSMKGAKPGGGSLTGRTIPHIQFLNGKIDLDPDSQILVIKTLIMKDNFCHNETGKEKLFSCENVKSLSSKSVLGFNLKKALIQACMQTANVPSNFDLYLDCKFANNFKKFYKQGWNNEAFIVPMQPKKYNSQAKYYKNAGLLIESVSTWSTKPVLLFAVEGDVQRQKLWETVQSRNGNTIVFWLKRTLQSSKLHWSFLKLRALLLSFTVNYVQLDVGVLVGPLIDRLFSRSLQNIQPNYPYPVFPAMDLGHSCPTGTVYSFPFLGQLALNMINLANEKQSHIMGNDWLARPASSRHLTKVWCKWNLWSSSVRTVLKKGIGSEQHNKAASGQPVVFWYAIYTPEFNVDMISIEQNWAYLKNLTKEYATNHWVAFNGNWYSSLEEVQNLNLSCII
eukprot:m.276618 g.276618  ORF g.276618 m.276618 type:complete len:416 (+) comp16303_c0_seq1:1601-2848(+)